MRVQGAETFLLQSNDFSIGVGFDGESFADRLGLFDFDRKYLASTESTHGNLTETSKGLTTLRIGRGMEPKLIFIGRNVSRSREPALPGHPRFHSFFQNGLR